MKEKYIAPTTSSRLLETTMHMLTGSISVDVDGGGTDTSDDNLPEVKKEFDFGQGCFDENPFAF